MGRMASHTSSRHTSSATNTPVSLTDLHRERALERSKTTNLRTSPYDEPVRLRNACDPCHQLKRKCSGEMPCENCTLSNSTESCLYRPVNRLGRPRGSRNRQKASTQSRTNSKQQRRLPASERHHVPTPPATDPMSFSLDSLEHSTSEDMAWDCLLDEDLLTLSSRANTDMDMDALTAADLNSQHINSCPSSAKSSYATMSNTLFGTLPHEQPCHEQQRLHRQAALEWPQSCSSSPTMPHPCASPDCLHNHHNKKARQRLDSINSPCQCAQGLRTLLTSLGRSTSVSTSSGSQTQQHQLSERPLYPVDTVLSNATRALEQWSAFELCHCCYSTSGEEQIENTFLLAFLSVQCVLGQLRSLPCSDSDLTVPATTCVRVGTFDVTGQKRASILCMLRVALAQEIENAVEALRCKIHDPCAANDGRAASSGLLAQIDVMFQDLAMDIRMLQQQGTLVATM
ncbi:hypothetical protein ACJQWK_04200 [Exserohilum turcicum]|uniref:Zn(2)-C6 fungal-type domain-containing protein n=1 Tax=Exserohilum turcicum (strain 28A) TaxID=671987 RepID=R0J4C5_EXST2|nr:uncharacterized protein SETTUDRAFT_30115 [Exserohilum turcica Et28A]EOA91586.1 hypothetical protein SETTUDRAFT_30115 [Exserohilum turcica Et28A]